MTRIDVDVSYLITRRSHMIRTNIDKVAHAQEAARQAGLLTGKEAQANLNIIATCKDPQGLAIALEKARQFGLFIDNKGAQAAFEIIAHHHAPLWVAMALVRAAQADLLTGISAQENREAISACQYPMGIATGLDAARQAGLLPSHHPITQERFNQLTTYSNIFTNTQTSLLWSRIPTHFLTEAVWNRIMQICRANQVNPTAGQVQLARYINNELLATTDEAPEALNPKQSTHTASVHQTVSESVNNLKALYWPDIDGKLNEHLETIKAWVYEQPERAIEKRAITYLIDMPFDFTDPVSQVTTKELLALSWCAIHDDTKRIGTLDDAQTRFLEGLYDVQRAYNLSPTFEDRGGEDKRACASGTFNKLVSVLVGVHPDVNIEYITSQGALRKIIPLIKEATEAYLTHLPSIEQVTVTTLKTNILPQVREALYFEYGGPTFKSLTSHYNTFESFKASTDYQAFQVLLQKSDQVDLELLIEGKLLVEDQALDEQIQTLIEAAGNRKSMASADLSSEEAPKNRPLTREEVQAIREKYYSKFSESHPDANDKTPVQVKR